jgi:hypothetical protein
MLQFKKILVVLCLALSCTTVSVHARRRSRIDLPIKNAADAPLEDNVAMASELTAETASLPQTTMQSDVVESNSDSNSSSSSSNNDITSSSESNSSEESQDCDNIDNISFELVTG